MRKYLLLFLSIFLLLVLFAGCSMTMKSEDGNLGYFPEARGTATHNIRVSKPIYYIIHPNFISLTNPNHEIDRILRSEFKHDTKFIKDLDLTFRITFIDFLFTYVPIISRETVVIKGTAYSQ